MLSAGEKKRVALADALMLRPRMLLLDDFLAGLDCGMRDALAGVLSDAAAFSSVIATGHEIDDFMRLTKRFLVLDRGVASELSVEGDLDRKELLARVRGNVAGGGI